MAVATADPREIVVRRGRPLQAGTIDPGGKWIESRRRVFEENLYEFSKGILRRDRFTGGLHRPVCDWLQRVPPYRKLLLMPRDSYKSTIVSKCLPIHVHIQPKDRNVYFDGRLGRNCRVLLAGETDKRAMGHVSWVKRQWESNVYLRAFWPEVAWENPLRQAAKWNESEIMLPRTEDFSESSLVATGVGGAITGAHFDMLLKDDLTTFAAANSPTVMQAAIDWHIASRALLDDIPPERKDQSLEFIIGTKWAAGDLPQYVIDHEPDADRMIRSIIEDGKPIMPEVHTLETIAELEKRYGVLFYFMYMNNLHVAQVADFDSTALRVFAFDAGDLVFDEDERDSVLYAKMETPAPLPDVPRGSRLTRESWQMLYRPGEGLRFRAN